MSLRERIATAGLVAVLAATARAPAARAEPPTTTPPAASRADASSSFREAQAAFARRDFAAAAAAFELAARAAPHPATWLNAAEAWAKRGDWARAAEDCDRALEIPDGDADLRREAESRLHAALEHVATVEARGARAFGARIDGGAVQPLPVRRRLAPGTHEVVLVDLASGHEEPHVVTVAAGQTTVLDAPVSPPAPAAATPRAANAAAPRSGPPTAAWVALGIGGAAAIGTTVLGFVTLGDKRSFEDHPTQDGLDRFHRDRALTNVFLGVTVVALGTGVALWLLSPSRAAETASSHGTLVRLQRDGAVLEF
jgi:hypothetical protein